MKKSNLSNKLRYNWLIDAILFIAALLAILTGLYFLIFPQGGYMGGRNPTYGIVILFDRHTWEGLHEWTGIAMIAGAIIHILFHWKWIIGTLKRVFANISNQSERFGKRLLWTIVVDGLIALGFFVSALSGLYFFFAAKGANWLLADTTWDMLHTWGSIVLIMASLIHVNMHWAWIKNITAKLMGKKKSPAVSGAPILATQIGGE